MKFQSLDDCLNGVAAQNEGQPEFLQAVTEVMTSLWPFIERNPVYGEHGLIHRLVEPERTIIFRVPWVDDKGQVQVNRGFRIQHSSAIGPFKGGIRFHPTVNLSVLKFLAFEQTFKNALTTLPMGGGKGGSNFDPKGRSPGEMMRFCQAFIIELHRHIGADTDVPAGDIGVGGREIGYMFGQYRKITNRHESGVFTGKGVGWGGAQVRTEATGYGAVFFAEEMLGTRGDSIAGKRVAVSGSGNVAIYAIEKVTQLGGIPVTASDSTGYIVDDAGIDIELLKQVKEQDRLRISEYAARRPSARFVEGGNVWEVPVDVAVPSATQNELSPTDAETLIANGVLAVAEGANMPCFPGAIAAFQAAGTLFAPGKAANAGGVATSALEMSQNHSRQRWSFDDSETRLRDIMRNVHTAAFDASERYGAPGDYVLGANSVAFERVAQAMLAQGVI